MPPPFPAHLPTVAALYSCVEIDFAKECLPAPAIYPEHADAPFLDAAAVGRWLARRLPLLADLRLELRHSMYGAASHVAGLYNHKLQAPLCHRC